MIDVNTIDTLNGYLFVGTVMKFIVLRIGELHGNRFRTQVSPM